MKVEKVMHGRWFFYEDPDSGNILRARYENHGVTYSTLAVEIPYKEKKWNLFGYRFGSIVERYRPLFNSRQIDVGPVMDKKPSYDVDHTLERMKMCIRDWTSQTGGFDQIVFEHSEFLGNKKLMREQRIDEILD